MGIVYWSATPLPSVDEIPALRAYLDESFPLADNSAYLDRLMGSESRRPLPRVVLARLCALSLLPSMLAHAGITPQTIRLTRSESGRPYGQDLSEDRIPFDFNLSHSDAHVVCALLVGDGQIGVDAEELLTPTRALPLIHHFCTEGEKKNLDALSDEEKAAAFTRIWTIREAVAKQNGQGMPLRYDAARIPATVRVFCGSIPQTETRVALCVPRDIGMSEIISLRPAPAVSWQEAES